MSQPVQNLCDTRQLGPLRQIRTVDHQHRHAKRPCGVQLGARAGAARVLGHHQLNAVLPHQRLVIRKGERPARDNDIAVRQRQRARFIDKPQQIAVLRLSGKVLKMHPTNSQKDALRRTGHRGDCTVDIGDVVPSVALLRRPCRAGQRGQCHSGFATRCDGIPAHLRGKGVGGINHVGHSLVAQVTRQTFGTAKPADAYRQRLRARVFNATCIGISGWNALFGHGFGQRVGLGRATKDQEVCHA